MTPATPVSRRRRSPSRSWIPPATRISASYDRTRSRVRGRSGSAPPWLRTKRTTPARASSPMRPSTVGGVARRQGNAASRSGRGSSPTASQSPAIARQARRSSGRSAMAVVSDHAGRAGREGEPDRLVGFDAARQLERDGDPGRDRPDHLEVGRCRRPVRRRSRRGGGAGRPSPRTARRSGPAGRSGAPIPAPAPGQ